MLTAFNNIISSSSNFSTCLWDTFPCTYYVYSFILIGVREDYVLYIIRFIGKLVRTKTI